MGASSEISECAQSLSRHPLARAAPPQRKKAPGGTGAFQIRDTRAARRLRVLGVPLNLANPTTRVQFGSVLEANSGETV